MIFKESLRYDDELLSILKGNKHLKLADLADELDDYRWWLNTAKQSGLREEQIEQIFKNATCLDDIAEGIYNYADPDKYNALFTEKVCLEEERPQAVLSQEFMQKLYGIIKDKVKGTRDVDVSSSLSDGEIEIEVSWDTSDWEGIGEDPSSWLAYIRIYDSGVLVELDGNEEETDGTEGYEETEEDMNAIVAEVQKIIHRLDSDIYDFNEEHEYEIEDYHDELAYWDHVNAQIDQYRDDHLDD